ncbi:MAG: type II secretion system protein [Nitrospirota bacterium]|nr:type II secretion system protein [Nitrospirota bacterium]
MKRPRMLFGEAGMTMIEMIGVLGVIAVLAAIILPRVFDVITESKVESLVVATQTFETAITKYYTHVGTVLPLNPSGVPAVESTGDSTVEHSLAARLTLPASDPLVLGTSLWPKFQGPYLERFHSNLPPEIGSGMFIPAVQPIEWNTPVTSSNFGWDLRGDDGNSDLPTDSHVVFFKLQGIGPEEFIMLDKMLDPSIGNTDSQRIVRGRAKWDTANNGTLYLYLAHQ